MCQRVNTDVNYIFYFDYLYAVGLQTSFKLNNSYSSYFIVNYSNVIQHKRIDVGHLTCLNVGNDVCRCRPVIFAGVGNDVCRCM